MLCEVLGSWKKIKIEIGMMGMVRHGMMLTVCIFFCFVVGYETYFMFCVTVRVDSLFNREALQEYILYATQHPAGGLRDKPPK